MTRALITGITGQDGTYLAEFLLAKGYEVHGLVRRSSTERTGDVARILARITVHAGDMLDSRSLRRAVERSAPDEIYNLAAETFVPASFERPEATGAVTGLGVVRLLEAACDVAPRVRFYQAGSSEMFGDAERRPQDESTPFAPRSPYGAAKVFAHHVTRNFRESRGLFACSGILFNHESPRRGLDFVTRKITDAAARIALGLADRVGLGNLDARRDWGFAGDYVRAMWLMLKAKEPRDYVIATGVSRSIREFGEAAFARAGLRFADHVVTDPAMIRPADVQYLAGDAAAARRDLGWEPSMTFEDLVAAMVDADLERWRRRMAARPGRES